MYTLKSLFNIINCFIKEILNWNWIFVLLQACGGEEYNDYK